MQIIVNKNNICVDSSEILNENEYNINQMNFTFSEDYADNLTKVALFTQQKTTYTVIIVNNSCFSPPEILANRGDFVLGIYAYEVQNEELILRFSPSPIKLFISSGSYIRDEDTENSEPITPSELEQYQQALQDGLAEVNGKLTEINEAIEHVNEAVEDVDAAVESVNNIDIDVTKEGKVTTVTLNKKDGTVKTTEINDGVSLQYAWQDTSLGVKREDEQSYEFVDLKGEKGEKGDCNFATFEVSDTMELVMNKTEDMLLEFILSEDGYLSVAI